MTQCSSKRTVLQQALMMCNMVIYSIFPLTIVIFSLGYTHGSDYAQREVCFPDKKKKKKMRNQTSLPNFLVYTLLPPPQHLDPFAPPCTGRLHCIIQYRGPKLVGLTHT